MSNTFPPEVEELLDSIAKDLTPKVSRIEGEAFPTTKNHYGDYMSILTVLGNNDESTVFIIAAALKRAGANSAGVYSALRVMGHL